MCIMGYTGVDAISALRSVSVSSDEHEVEYALAQEWLMLAISAVLAHDGGRRKQGTERSLMVCSRSMTSR